MVKFHLSRITNAMKIRKKKIDHASSKLNDTPYYLSLVQKVRLNFYLNVT